jgi:N-formylglutamate deformylase
MNISPQVSVLRGHPELTLPLICDSPHSGVSYPADFGHAVPMADLRMGEDTHVERLWAHTPEVGATLIAALFPRSYIDTNRSLLDLDAEMLAEPWPETLSPSHKTELGYGLVWRQMRVGTPIYARKLSVAEVQQRIATCWRPYHDTLRAATDEAFERFGCYWHLNLHSMPHDAYQRLGIVSPVPLADFVLGDRSGTSCDAEFLAVVKQAIEKHGYRVAVNDPYVGQELVRLMGQPQAGRHSLQIEINRKLYMDEPTREPSAGFGKVQADLSEVIEEVARYVRLKSQAPG